MKALAAEGIAPFRFHDLRHTHVAWLVAGGAPLPHIQARLGHESITTTIDTYGHLLPAGDELISGIIDTALTGGTIRPKAGAWCAPAVSRPCWDGLAGSVAAPFTEGPTPRPTGRKRSQPRSTSVALWETGRGRDRLFTSGEELVEVLLSESDVLAEALVADLPVADRVGHPSGRNIEVCRCTNYVVVGNSCACG